MTFVGVKSIKEISIELGFNSEYRFSALFKQKIGLSPITFRSAIENQSNSS